MGAYAEHGGGTRAEVPAGVAAAALSVGRGTIVGDGLPGWWVAEDIASGPGEMTAVTAFWFLLIALVVVVAAVTLAVLGSGGGGDGHEARGGVSGGLEDAPPDRLEEPLPQQRPVRRTDLDQLRLQVGLRGYEMREVDDVLDRLGAELAERDARIAELESALAGARGAATIGTDTGEAADPPEGAGETGEHGAR